MRRSDSQTWCETISSSVSRPILLGLAGEVGRTPSEVTSNRVASSVLPHFLAGLAILLPRSEPTTIVTRRFGVKLGLDSVLVFPGLRPSIACQIDGAVPHPARPPTLRASRYRTFSHGWAFRPIEPDHDQSFGVPKCGHCQGGVAARRAVDRWSARSAGCRAAPERPIGPGRRAGALGQRPRRQGRQPRSPRPASTTPGG